MCIRDRYQVDNDGEWGEISFDFEAGTAEIIRLAEWDTTVSKKFAQKAIQYILTCNSKLCKETTLISVSYTHLDVYKRQLYDVRRTFLPLEVKSGLPCSSRATLDSHFLLRLTCIMVSLTVPLSLIHI